MQRWLNSSYGQIFQYQSFRAFWLGYSISILGDTITRVALTWFVYQLTDSAQALGWLTFWYTFPVIVGGLLAGWLLDRFDRRMVMLIDNLLRAAIVALIPLLHHWGALALWHVYLVAAVYGLLMMIPLAGGPALVPSLAPAKHMATANALESLSFTLSGVIGPPMAGFLLAWLAAPHVLILDVISYLVFALLLIQVKPLAQPARVAASHTSAYRLGDAVNMLLTNRTILATTLMFMTFNIGFGAMFVWLPIFADQTLGGGAELYGTLLGFLALGEVISSILVGSITLPLALETLICLAQFLSGVSLTLLLLWPQTGWATLSLTLFGLFSAPLTIWAQTLRMRVIPESLRGRMFALLRTLMQGTNPLGGIWAGLALPLFGILAVIGLSALLIGVPGLVGYKMKLHAEKELLPYD